jgi:hypothetical protein
MRFTIFLLAFLSLPYCFAQASPMKYFYKDRKEEALPDFAALAVLERQNCPSSIALNIVEYIEQNQICTSHYRILRVLDAVSDTLRKEYLEVKEEPVFPYFRHRPILIFGKYKNGMIHILEYEEMREYFYDISCHENCISFQGLYLFVSDWDDINSLHSIGTPYYDIKNLDSLDMIYYGEYLMPHIKRKVEIAGKSFSELLLRLIYNRKPIEAAPVKNEFMALGAIKNIRPAHDSKQAKLYELNMTIETVIKNDAKIESNISIFIDRDRLPPGWGCQPFDYYLKNKIAFYFFWDLKNGSLFIDSLVSPQDAFVFGDTIYDISMGFPFEELMTYFIPPNILLEEAKFGGLWEYLFADSLIQNNKTPKRMELMPECLRNAIIEISIKWRDFFDNRRFIEKAKIKWEWPFLNFLPIYVHEKFRCRNPYNLNWEKNEKPECYQSYLEDKDLWGKEW